VPVLVAADGATWEAELVAALERGEYGITVARRCLDVVELLAVGYAGQGRAALVSAALRRLDADAVDRLLAAAVVPIGVVPRGDIEAEERLRAMGVTCVVPADAQPAVMAAVVLDAISREDSEDPAASTHSFADPYASGAGSFSGVLPPGAGEPVPDTMSGRRGRIVAVWGPTGAPGRTTVAINLADSLARLGSSALLVDGDVYGASIAPALGLLDESPGLAAACRHAAAHRLDAAGLAALCWQLTPQLRVLTGIPIASRWPELRPAGVEAVLAAARGLAEFAVVDCGFCLETDEELSYDTIAPRRNGATLAMLGAADEVVVVGAADPIGMQRLVRALSDLDSLAFGAEVRVVLNGVRRGVVPGDPAKELTGALERFAGRAPSALLPYDRTALDEALAGGRSLAEGRAKSPLREAIVRLAAELADVPLPHASRSAGRRRAATAGR